MKAARAVRGLLCNSCNLVLGYVKDDPVVLDRLAAYLRHHTAAGSRGIHMSAAAATTEGT